MRSQRHAPAAPYPRERPGTHFTGGWVDLRAGLAWCAKSRPTGIRSPDRPVRRQSLYRLRYPAHTYYNLTFIFYLYLYLYLLYSVKTGSVISVLHREVDKNCFLLGYYATSSGNFLPTFRNKDSWALKMGPISCPETSVRNYHYSPRNNPEERSSQDWVSLCYDSCWECSTSTGWLWRKWNIRGVIYKGNMSLAERSCVTAQNLPLGVNNIFKMRNVTTTSDNTGALVSWNISRYMPLLSDVGSINRKWVIFGLCHYCIQWAMWKYVKSNSIAVLSATDHELTFLWSLPNHRLSCDATKSCDK